tara:strand:- start:995 stop:1702 length:708 start_codon:yes stop_codon:yes gene_type:complete
VPSSQSPSEPLTTIERNITIAIICIALILVGLIFGLNIQVSNDFISIWNSFSSTIGGLGAAAAAYLSYRSMDRWRMEFNHSKSYESLNEISLLIDEWFESLITTITSREICDLEPLQQMSLLSPRIFFKEYRVYNNSYHNILATIDKKYIGDVKTLEYSVVTEELNSICFEYIVNNQELMKLSNKSDVPPKNEEEFTALGEKLACHTDKAIDSLQSISNLKTSLQNTIHSLKCSS